MIERIPRAVLGLAVLGLAVIVATNVFAAGGRYAAKKL